MNDGNRDARDPQSCVCIRCPVHMYGLSTAHDAAPGAIAQATTCGLSFTVAESAVSSSQVFSFLTPSSMIFVLSCNAGLVGLLHVALQDELLLSMHSDVSILALLLGLVLVASHDDPLLPCADGAPSQNVVGFLPVLCSRGTPVALPRGCFPSWSS